MTTECTQESLWFSRQSGRDVVARFDGGNITSDGGGLLLGEVERRTGILRQFAACFTDHREAEQIEHTVEELVRQRVYGLALGYEDLNDHDELRRDPLLATLVGKADPLGRDRTRSRDRGAALAGKSTLNRLELTRPETAASSRYKKIVLDGEAVDRLLVDAFVQAHHRAPKQIILDLDATDDPLHGRQEGRFFHGYYGHYCYLPLYIFCGEHLLGARLRPSDIDASAGALEEVQRIVGRIRSRWPRMRIVLRADSGFAREAIMAWCEGSGVDYVFGLAKNARLSRVLGRELHQVKLECERTGLPARVFKHFSYRTRKTWSRARRVVGKAEHLPDKSNPRFVVTSLSCDEWDDRALYEDLYCARGDMENRIKEQQLYLFADRTSTATMRGNQTRLYFSSIAYLLLEALRRLGLKGTPLARAQCHTIRLKLLKIGAQIRVTVRKVWVSLASGSPSAAVFARACVNLRASPLRT
ncbi:MAG TPA: IS1380 family transposase [Candidatus Polarisedimenticolia bacterium]|nr:IS1380 family transposase [Candidatus Polarisedimenticolia bacterium]